jgi:uncharacterized protein (DUF849 family)
MDQAITRIKACLNGRRGRDEHPAVPVTPGEVAREAAAAAAAGAEAVHLHARGAGGGESLLAGDVGAAVAAVRQACPGLPVGVSTGLWITAGDHPARQAAVARWAGLPATARPDFASVNVSEGGWAEVARTLAGAGIGVEAGVWSVADVRAGAAEAAPGSLLRVMVEVMGAPPGQESAVAGEILTALDDSALRGVPRLLHGEGDGCWPLIRYAGRLGVATRIGLEDTLAGPDGGPVGGNGNLVQLALAVLDAARAPGGG